jgi:hypothetical protein
MVPPQDSWIPPEQQHSDHHMTVYRILSREALNHPLTKPRIKRTYRRWQRMHPNSLWQLDLKLVPPRWLITREKTRARGVVTTTVASSATCRDPVGPKIGLCVRYVRADGPADGKAACLYQGGIKLERPILTRDNWVST